MIELCKQVLIDIERECGVQCSKCSRIITEDEYYCRVREKEDVYAIVCVNCGLSKYKIGDVMFE